MKIKTFDDLATLNAEIEPIQKKLTAKKKALAMALKKVAKIEDEILKFEQDIENVLNDEPTTNEEPTNNRVSF